MDATSLGAMGVARTSQNSMSKLYNSPLSKTTISLIASASGEQRREKEEDKLSTAISSALALALLVGLLQLLVFTIGASQILAMTGVSHSGSMYLPAVAFMRARAYAAPSATLWLVATNVFRGLGDATTPLTCALVFNIINFICDHMLIRKWNLGIVGAALATAISQTLALVPLLFRLNKRVPIWFKFNISSFTQYLARYGRAGIYLLGRSLARIAAFSYCSRRSVLLGSVAASSYSVMYQIGMWVTFLVEGISIATQALLSRHLSDETPDGDYIRRLIVRRSFQMGALVTGTLSFFLYNFRNQIISMFAKNIEIQTAALDALPVFLLAQLAKGFAFPMNGIIMGGMDWSTSMWGMCFANLACFASLHYFGQSVRGLWIAWTVYYLAQGLVGILRYKSGTGVWKRLK